MDLNAVKMFVHVVQCNSLTAAAQRMDVPLPTLSRRIKELEQTLNVQLLERSVRGTKLTDAGTRLYEHASRGIETLAEAEQAVLSDQAQLKGRLRLTLPVGFEPWRELLRAFQTQYPDIELFIYNTERRVDLIEDGFDVALRIGSITHDTMVALHLQDYRHVVVASPALIARLGFPVQPGDLDRFPCATWGHRHQSVVWQLGMTPYRVQPRLVTNDYAHLAHQALAGQYVTELPPFLATPLIDEGSLIALLPDDPLPLQQINLLYPSHRRPSTIVRAYLNFCKAYIATHPL